MTPAPGADFFRAARPAIALIAWMTLQFMPTVPAMLDHSLKLQPWKTSVGKEAHARFERLVN